MNESATAVALLFDDSELGTQLREALQGRGARIVHEGEVSGLDRELLDRLDAEVLVINLDDAAVEALEGLYQLLDGDCPRVVFNDAQASRGLSGWELARWARHLAAKVLAIDDIDPPRPAGARGLETPSTAVDPSHINVVRRPFDGDTSTTTQSEDVARDLDAVLPLDDAETGMKHETLAAELAELLAASELPPEAEEPFGGERYADNDEMPPLHDGDFGEMPAEQTTKAYSSGSAETSSKQLPPSAARPAVFQLDHLQLAPMSETNGFEKLEQHLPVAGDMPEKASPRQAPDSWALVDDASLLDTFVDRVDDFTESNKPDPVDLGFKNKSAADFLALARSPDPGDESPGMSLELVSVREAVASQPYGAEGGHEIVLDMDGSALRRIVLLGAAAEGARSLAKFLAALPINISLPFLLILQGHEQSAPELLEQLSEQSAVPVRLAENNGRAVSGEILVVPAGYNAKVTRDGRVQLHPAAVDGKMSPSIDAGFSMAADVFGRDALGIVLGGLGVDGIIGAQAIHARGGQVWAEADDDFVTDLVMPLLAERLVSFSGDAPTLAAHLVEVFS